MSDKEMIEQGLATVQAKLDSALEKQNAELKDSLKASKKTNGEVSDLAKQFAEMQKELISMSDSLTGIEQSSAKIAGAGEVTESIGSKFAKSSAVSALKAGEVKKAVMEVGRGEFFANTITTGGDTSVTREFQLPGVVPGAFRQLRVMPTVAQGTIDSNLLKYSRELSWTNAAAETAENTTKPESTLTFEPVSNEVQTIAHWLKASKQALEDSSFLASYVDSRLSHGVSNRIERQVIAGDGTGSNLSGWLATGNCTIVSGAGTTDVFGLAHALMMAVIEADYSPDYFYVPPAVWSLFELLRRGTGDAAFVGGDGGVINYPANGMPAMLWGIPVIVSNNVPANQIICKSFDADMYFNRHDVRVEMFEQDGDNVTNNLVTIRAEARGVEAVMTPAAIACGDVTTITV